MKHLAGILFLLLVNTATQAQSYKGVVAASSDKSPLDFAPVTLIRLPDSTVVTGVQSANGGNFEFSRIKPGNYCVKVSFLGYATAKHDVTIKAGKSPDISDTIFLVDESKQLTDVVVTGEKIKGKELVDRTIFTIPSAISKTSTTGYDILKKIPSVQVDFQNNITMNGSSNFIIQVDGKQRDKEFLAKLNPSDIESVEVINNPSGKYEGTIDGVINVVLKKEARYGVNGNVDLNAKPWGKPSYVGSGSLDYSLGKINFYVSGFSFNQELDVSGTNNSIVTLYSKGIKNDSTTNGTGLGNMKMSNSSITTGFDYYMNDKNSLSFNVTYKPNSNDMNTLGFSDIKVKPSSNRVLESTHNSSDRSKEYNASLFYRHQFDKPVQEFTNETSFYIYNSNNNSLDSGKLYNTDNSFDKLVDCESKDYKNSRKYVSSKFDYVQPLGEKSRFEVGYQIYYQKIKYEDHIKTNEFEYNEFRNSAYAGFTSNLNKLGFQATLRVERSDFNTDTINIDGYFSFQPSANLQYKFNNTNNIKLTYNRKITRPEITSLNPFLIMNPDRTYSSGNPSLKPEYHDKVQLTYTLNIGSSYISPSIYYDRITDRIGEISIPFQSPSNGNTIKTTSDNIISGYETGVGLNAMLLFFNINARYYQRHNEAYQDKPAFDYTTFAINSYAFMPLPGKVNAFAFVGYRGVEKTFESKTESMTFYGFGARREFGNHTVGAFWFLPFTDKATFSKTTRITDGRTSQSSQRFDVRNYIQLSYSYRFHVGHEVKKIDKKVEIESDTKSNGIGAGN
jgi:hypothetical protein